MNKRQTPRVVPDRPHYLTLDIKERGPTVWRLPSPALTMLLVQLMNKDDMANKAAKAAKAAKGAKKKGAKAVAGVDLLKMYSVQGAVLGLCWFDLDFDLQTQWAEYPNTLEGLEGFGSEVFEELYEEGWSTSSTVDAWSQVLPKIVDTLVDQGRAADTVNFTKAPKAKQG